MPRPGHRSRPRRSAAAPPQPLSDRVRPEAPATGHRSRERSRLRRRVLTQQDSADLAGHLVRIPAGVQLDLQPISRGDESRQFGPERTPLDWRNRTVSFAANDHDGAAQPEGVSRVENALRWRRRPPSRRSSASHSTLQTALHRIHACMSIRGCIGSGSYSPLVRSETLLGMV